MARALGRKFGRLLILFESLRVEFPVACYVGSLLSRVVRRKIFRNTP